MDRPEDGKWAGYVFVKQQASDDLYPVKGARRDEVLARIAVDHRAAMVLYGHELGACGQLWADAHRRGLAGDGHRP